MTWRDEAACADRVDIDWFPIMDRPGGTTSTWRANVIAAKEVCQSCPVQSQCLAVALEDPLTAGIWGGTTEADRRRRSRPPRRQSPPPCGTDSAYYHHLRYTRTEPCDACREAHAMAGRVRNHRLAVVR